MSAQEWLDRTQAITDQATEGPWEAWGKREGGVWIETGRDEVLHHDRRGTGHLSEDYSWMLPGDAEFIAHARTALPVAVAALRAVLDQHQQADYQRHVPRMLRRTPEDHLPYRPCDGCREEWPCPTVKAITDALTSHQHPTPPGSSGKCEHEARGVTWAEGDTTCYVCETCEHEWTEER